ncbi:MAG TPA: isopeptide-forming domain-containing fimbrial protein, partial [Pyrinomonadaceae bacterium]
MMPVAPLKKRIAALLGALVLAHAAAVLALGVDGPTASGTAITNRAEATYSDSDGTTYGTVSPTVTVTILAVAALNVTPDETESSADVGPRERVVRPFRVCNTGNTPDFYSIARSEVNAPASIVSLHFDTDASGALNDSDALIRLGESLSPRLRPGSCVGVFAVVDTNDSPAGTRLAIRLTARSSVSGVNGNAEDDGTIINAVGSGAVITSPTDKTLPPVKMVNGSSQTVVSIGSPFTYTINFRNSGDTPARGVVVTDDLPAGVEYLSNTLALGPKNLSDAEDADEGFARTQQVVVKLAEVLPGQVVQISFKARLNGNAPAATGLSNTVNITGQNVTPTRSSPAVVVIDPFGVVFAGRGGSATPIPGAQVEVLQDQSGADLALAANAGFVPNQQNANPYTTGAQGRFSF